MLVLPSNGEARGVGQVTVSLFFLSLLSFDREYLSQGFGIRVLVRRDTGVLSILLGAFPSLVHGRDPDNQYHLLSFLCTAEPTHREPLSEYLELFLSSF